MFAVVLFFIGLFVGAIGFRFWDTPVRCPDQDAFVWHGRQWVPLQYHETMMKRR
jgi:hypothetical protein